MLETPTSTGTAFFVSRVSALTPDRGTAFLVTNKHVLGADRMIGGHLLIHANVESGSTTSGRVETLDYLATDIREHQIPDVDVCAVDATALAERLISHHRWLNVDEVFVTKTIASEIAISPGDDVLTVGYPLALRQGPTNAPIVRQGVLATSLSDELSGDAIVGRPGSLPAFLIDGGVLPGSSGSPVFLKPVIGRNYNGQVWMRPAPSYLLGIIAETRLAPVPGATTTAYAGLGMAFRASCIREVIDQFPAVN